MAAWGAAPDALDDYLGPRSDFEVWPENENAVWLFLRSQSQWVYAGMNGVRTGLNYAGVATVLAHSGWTADEQREAFAGLQVIEFAVLAG